MWSEEEVVTEGKDTSLAIDGNSQVEGEKPNSRTLTPADREYENYTHLIGNYLKTLIRWKEILQQPKYLYRGFDILASPQGSYITPHEYGSSNASMPKRIFYMEKQTDLDLPEHALVQDRFIIRPGLAGKGILIDPEDSVPLQKITIIVGDQGHIPEKEIEFRTERSSIKREGYSDHRNASYGLRSGTIQVNYLIPHHPPGMMTDEMVSSLLNTIDSLIPDVPSTPSQSGRADKHGFFSLHQLLPPRKTPTGRT